MFTKNDLKTGMFGAMNDGTMFVVVNDNLIYKHGGWDKVRNLSDDLSMICRKITKVYDECNSFNHLESSINGTTYTPANLVYDRERDTKPLYNGKVVCIDLMGRNSNLYTVGKIYQFKNGQLTADNCKTYPSSSIYNDHTAKIYDFSDWNKWTTSKFIEIKE